MNKSFSEVLREFLRDNHMTQTAFARAIGVKPSRISEWLRGKNSPNYQMLQKMSFAFDISADYFLGLSESY